MIKIIKSDIEGLLETVFRNGKLTKFQTLNEIRERVNKQIGV